jgi:hypothetical protein
VEAPVHFFEELFCQRGPGQSDSQDNTDHSLRREVDFFRPDEEEVKTGSRILKVYLGSQKFLELNADWLTPYPIYSTCWSPSGLTSFLEKTLIL